MKTLQGVLYLSAMAILTNCGDIFIDDVNVDAENSGDLTGTVNVEPIGENETTEVADEIETTTDTTAAETDAEETPDQQTITTEGTPEILIMDEEDAGKADNNEEEAEDAEPYENIYIDVCAVAVRASVDTSDIMAMDVLQDFGHKLVCGANYDTVLLVEANKLIRLGVSIDAINSLVISNEYYIITAFEYELASETFEKITRDSMLNLDFCIIYRYYDFDCPDKHWDDVEFNSCQLTRMNDANLSDCLYQEIREYFE